MKRPEITPRTVVFALLVLVVVLAAVKSGWRLVQNRSAVAAVQNGLRVLGSVPDFEFTDRSGRTIRRADLIGKIWVADFIFTNCAGTCPMMTMRMKELQEAVQDVDRLYLVSFSVDPDRDTPEALNAYAARHGIDQPNWHLLCGDRAAVYGLANEGFRFAVGEVAPEDRRPGDEAILHSDRLALVDAQGRVRGVYRGAGPDSEAAVQQLANDIRALMKEPPSP